ncbi:MAG: hypothetical protein PHS54_04325 [Clostridia bacterium]|nr:hypothetical protein [Clostridia bacterium]
MSNEMQNRKKEVERLLLNFKDSEEKYSVYTENKFMELAKGTQDEALFNSEKEFALEVKDYYLHGCVFKNKYFFVSCKNFKEIKTNIKDTLKYQLGTDPCIIILNIEKETVKSKLSYQEK